MGVGVFLHQLSPLLAESSPVAHNSGTSMVRRYGGKYTICDKIERHVKKRQMRLWLFWDGFRVRRNLQDFVQISVYRIQFS